MINCVAIRLVSGLRAGSRRRAPSGQRRGEIAALQTLWLSADRITLPSAITKNGREHTFQIGAFAASILKPIIASASEEERALILPARGRPMTPFSGWSKGKPKLDELCAVDGWTLHDLRRTFATGLAALGTPIYVTEKILNHVSGTTGGLVAVYQRHQFWDEQIAAMNAWENTLGRLLNS